MIHARGEDVLQNSIRFLHPFGYLGSEMLLGDGTQLMIGFGGDAERCDPADLAATQAASTDTARLEVLDATSHDWFADEFSLGTWAIHRPGWYEHHHAAMRRPEGNVFWPAPTWRTAGPASSTVRSSQACGRARGRRRSTSRTSQLRSPQRAPRQCAPDRERLTSVVARPASDVDSCARPSWRRIVAVEVDALAHDAVVLEEKERACGSGTRGRSAGAREAGPRCVPEQVELDDHGVVGVVQRDELVALVGERRRRPAK